MNHAEHVPIVSKIFSGVFDFFKKHKTYSAFLFVIITLIIVYAALSSPLPTGETHTVTSGKITQFVKVNGQVQASRDANLAFQTGGQVAFVGVKSGQMVEQGKVLATLQAGDAQAQLLQAEAKYANTEAKLDQLKQGARKEGLAVKEQALSNAKNALEQTYYTLPDAIQNVDAVTADVIKNRFSNLFNFSTSRYTVTFSSCNQVLQSDIEDKRTNLENVLAAFQIKSSTVSALSSPLVIDATFDLAYDAALRTNDLVNSISNLLLASCSTSNSSLDALRVSLTSAKGSMTTLFSDITSKRNALYLAKNTVNQVSRNLELAKAGTDPYVLKSQVALLSQAEAEVAQAKSGLQKTFIVAPFSGVISDIGLSIGETASLGKTVITMLAVDSYEIEAKVPEIDIIKIKIGSSADVILDAYGKSVIFPASVTRVSPAASTEGTVPVYKVIVTFRGRDERIKQGMTANVDINTETKMHVFAVPARFIKVMKGNKGTVILKKDDTDVTRDITLGIRGKDGLVEVVTGLLEGDVIMSPEIGTKEAQKQTN